MSKQRRRIRKTQKRRKLESKTDYMKRIKILKSELPRVVFRKSNRYIGAQLVESSEAQDSVKISVYSKILLSYGWPKEYSGSLKSIPASYLTGLIMGKEIKKLKKTKVIIDIGMNRNVHKSRIYAFVKGLVDTGIHINSKKEIFPDEKRIRGEHMKNKKIHEMFDKIKSKIGEDKWVKKQKTTMKLKKKLK